MNKIDEQSIALVSGFFDHGGNKVLVTPDEYDPFDIEVTPTSGSRAGHTLAIEVKGRPFTHDRYPTMMVEYSKLQKACDAIQEGKYSDVIVVSVYADAVAIAKIDDPEGRRGYRMCPQTSHFGRTEYIRKDVLDLPLRRVFSRADFESRAKKEGRI